MKIQKTSSSTSSKSSSSHHAGNLKSSSTESNQSNHFETNFDTFEEPAAVDQQEEEEEIDLNIFVSDLLDQMTSRFDNVSKSILNRIDAMGDRIDDLEKNINELVLTGEGQKVGTGGSASGGAIGLDAQGETI